MRSGTVPQHLCVDFPVRRAGVEPGLSGLPGEDVPVDHATGTCRLGTPLREVPFGAELSEVEVAELSLTRSLNTSFADDVVDAPNGESHGFYALLPVSLAASSTTLDLYEAGCGGVQVKTPFAQILGAELLEVLVSRVKTGHDLHVQRVAARVARVERVIVHPAHLAVVAADRHTVHAGVGAVPVLDSDEAAHDHSLFCAVLTLFNLL